MLTRRNLLKASAASGLGAFLAACAGPGTASPSASPQPSLAGLTADDGTPAMQTLIKAAQKEAKLNYYCSVVPQIASRLIGGFTSRYGIEVTLSRQVTATNTARITAEVEGGKPIGDIGLLTSLDFLATGSQKNWFVNPYGMGLPAVESFPKDYVVNGIAFTQVIAGYDVAYNTNLVKGDDIPKKWTDLLNPKWKNQIIISDPRGNDSSLGFFYTLGQVNGPSFLSDLGKQSLKVFPGAAQAYGPLGAGDAAMVLPNTYFNTATLAVSGAPIADVFLNPTSALEEYMFIVKGSPNPNAALLFLNYSLSTLGQNVQCADLCSSVLTPNVPGVIPAPGYKSAQPLFKAAAADKAKILSAMGLS